MKKIYLALLLCILGISTGWGAHTITGDGSHKKATVEELSGSKLTSIAVKEAWTLTLDVENPEGKSFNSWGSTIMSIGSNIESSSDGLQLYLCSQTNGGKLRAVFTDNSGSGSRDHDIPNVTYIGNFRAIITYDGGAALTIETINSAGNKDKKEYTLSVPFPAITEFSTNIPTGINVTGSLSKPRSSDYSTTATKGDDGKMYFTSGEINCDGKCNKLRFTLTGSGAIYGSGAKRMSFDSFTLYNADGNEVKLKASQFSGNNGKESGEHSFANMLDGVNGKVCCGEYGLSGATDDWFEITLPEDLGGSFKFAFVTENETMDARAFRIEFFSEYTLKAEAPGGSDVALFYNGINMGNRIDAGVFNKDLISAPHIYGYTWAVETDHNALTATVRYPEAEYNEVETPAKSVNSKMHFTSDDIYYLGKFNRMRFTLTESAAFYDGGAKRMSFDSFTLYNADGDEVELQVSQFSGNNEKNYANMLDGVNNTYCSEWGTKYEDDYFEIFPIEDLGGAFSFAFVTENVQMNAKAFCIDLSYVYRLAVDAPEGTEVSIAYNGAPVQVGEELDASAFDDALLTATDIAGYTWAVVVDEATATLTVRYTEAVAPVKALVDRIGGAGTAGKFSFVLDPAISTDGNEVFVLDSEDGKILIKGSTLSAITAGLGWYLNHHAHINIAWNSLNEKGAGEAYADLSDLPLPSTEETHTCDAKYRYYLNYCTFGYSMTSWTWTRWQQEIDWMALHGINMPLQIIGLEEVWRKFLTMESIGKRKYNYTDGEAKAFVAGPAFTAWWGMNNLEGWGGTGDDGWSGVQDDAWYARQVTLAHNILDRQRELGMQPVLPGFSGMVPSNFTEKTTVATDNNGGNWCGFTRPYIVDPTAERFAEIAADYYACLEEVMGRSQYYSMDPFHEGGSISSGKYSEAYRAIYDAMDVAKSGSQWVIQQWQWKDYQQKSLTAVPAGRLLVLDLFSDGSPAFDGNNGYAPQEAIFCAIPNFGGRSGLMGRLNNLTDNYFTYKAKYTSIKGVGAAPEAIEQTPVTYDLLFQLPWMGSKPNVEEWVRNYSMARYGVENEVVQEAWELLRNSALNYGADGIQGPIEDVWAARPNLDASPASAWGMTLNDAGGTYTRARRQMLADATYKLLGESENLGLTSGSIYESNYLYDLVEFGGAVMADYAYDLLLGIKSAKEAAGDNFNSDATYCARRNAFLALIKDMDTFKGTNLNFRLGKWTQEAREAAAEVTGATSATPDWYEFNNARTIITTWGDQKQNGGLKDYSYRSWQGLLEDYYLPRWKYFFDNNCQGTNYFFFEWNWAHGMKHSVGDNAKSTTRLAEGEKGYRYLRVPEGNTVEEAQKLFDNYIIPVTLSDGMYYAYRYLDNDLADQLTIVANGSAIIDLTRYFGEQKGAKVTGDFIDGEATDLSNVVLKASLTDGQHTGTVILADRTTLTFTIVANPPFYGTYKINYNATNPTRSGSAFIAYNEEADGVGVIKGNKLIAEGTKHTADTEASEIFTIVPHGEGFSISAQGQYLKAHTLDSWRHITFSEDDAEAGTYVVEKTGVEGEYWLRHTGSGKRYVSAYDVDVFGSNDYDVNALSTFTFTEVTEYHFTITSAGMATLCLPFNVVLPEGLTAFDFAVSNISEGEGDTYVCTMQAIAKGGDILKAGTPVIIKGDEDVYYLEITMSDEDACTSLDGSLLRGNFLKQNLEQSAEAKKFIFTKPTGKEVGFYRMTNSSTIGANKCWMEWDVPAAMSNARAIVLDFSTETGIQDIITTPQSRVIYNLNGQRMSAPQKGVNIIGNRKVIIK